jgi:hypothetical protein
METTALTMFNATVKVENENIWIKPACDFFKLHVQNQYTKIKNDPILGKLYGKNSTDFAENDNLAGKNRTDLGEIDANGRVLLSRKGFLRWVQIINPNIIDEALVPQFLVFQELIFDYLIGSAEEQKHIGDLNSKLQELKAEYGRLGAEVKATQKALFEALNHRYQYSLQFSENTSTTALS